MDRKIKSIRQKLEFTRPAARRTFYIRVRPIFVVPFITVPAFISLALFAWAMWPNVLPAIEISLITLGIFLVAVLDMALSCTVSVTDRGITLYKVNRLKWSDVSEVRQYTKFRLPYLKVFRLHGRPWGIPLYLRDLPGFYAALAEFAPPDNPLRLYAESTRV